MLTIRVRSKVGTWRLELESASATIAEVKAQIEKLYTVPPHQQTLCLDQSGVTTMADSETLAQHGLMENGAMVYLLLDPDAVPPAPGQGKQTMGRKIGADGSIVATTYDDHVKAKGFRPGMAALGDMKKAWTLSEFQLMDAQFEFKLQRQTETTCAAVSLDGDSCQVFQGYLQQLGWRQARVGVLYGTFEEDNSVRVEAIREPPQNNTATAFELLDDPDEATVEHVAGMLKLRKVGWVFAHPPREDGFVFSAREVLRAAMEQLEAGDGPEGRTPFVTVRVTVNPEDGTSAFDAYQVSNMCMEMVAEGALEEDEENPGSCKVHPTFTAIQEGKAAPLVDNNFFLCNVPVKTHTSALLNAHFPKANRDAGEPQTRDALRARLSASGKSYIDALADFELLLFLCAFPEIFDPHSFIPAICDAVAGRPRPVVLDAAAAGGDESGAAPAVPRISVARPYQPIRPILQGALATRKPNPFANGISAAIESLREVEAQWGDILNDQVPNAPDYPPPPGFGAGIPRPKSRA